MPSASRDRRWYSLPLKAWLMTAAALALLLVGAGVGIFVSYSSPPALVANEIHAAPSTHTWTTVAPPPTSSTLPSSGTTTTTTPPDGTGLVTSQLEQSVLTQTWVPFAAAFAEDNTAAMKSLTTPEAYQAITGSYNCGCPPWPTAYSSVSFSSPPEPSYPLTFWAEFEGQNYDGTPLTKEVLFSQSSASSPWLVADIGAFTPGQDILASSSSYTGAVPASSMSVEAVGEAFAQYFQDLDATGNATWPQQFIMDGVVSELQAGSLSTYEQEQAENWTTTYQHTVVDTSASMPVPDESGGGIFACFTMDVQRVVQATPNHPIIQSDQQPAFPPLLAAGSYASVTSSSLFETCFTETTSGQVLVVTNEGGAVAVTGTPQ